MLYRVKDSRIEDVSAGIYDCVFFASGYEERCTHVAKRLPPNITRKSVLLGFKEAARHPQRCENDRYFLSNWVENEVTLSSEDDGPVFGHLRDLQPANEGHLQIMVDYSSMSRVWYAAILNWARFATQFERIDIDLVYATGDHREPERPMVITQMVSIPGCEGSPEASLKSVAVFGLGFEGQAALCVLDRLEPDEFYTYLAGPGSSERHRARAKTENAELIRHANGTFELPLASVERTYSDLSEVIARHRSKANIVFIPMGPKPHVLAAILLAIRFREVSCLRVSGKRDRPARVGATGETVVTRVEFRGRDRED